MPISVFRIQLILGVLVIIIAALLWKFGAFLVSILVSIGKKICHKISQWQMSILTTFNNHLAINELKKLCSFSGGVDCKKRYIIASGNGSNKESIISLKKSYSRLTVGATFKSLTKKKEHQYWRYGIRIKNNEGKEIALFHLDNNNLIVLYSKNMDSLSNYKFMPIFKYISEDDFNNKSVALKVRISIESQAFHASFYLNDNFITSYQKRNAGTGFSASLLAWSDDKKNHLVEIRDIIIRPS